MPLSSPVVDPVRRARAYLLAVAEPPVVALTALIAARGPVETAALVRAGTVPGAVLDETAARRAHDRVDEHFAAAARVGARLVTPEDAEWPTHLAVLSPGVAQGARWAAPPVALWVRGPGQLADRLERGCSVVGARAATGYGEHVAAEFGYGLAGAGWTVVSGAAYGIDGAAHRGALAAEGSTVAVLGCGIDIAYPAGHADLLDRIAERGMVISEYPPGTPPARHRFLIRTTTPYCSSLAAADCGGTGALAVVLVVLVGVAVVAASYGAEDRGDGPQSRRYGRYQQWLYQDEDHRQ